MIESNCLETRQPTDIIALLQVMLIIHSLGFPTVIPISIQVEFRLNFHRESHEESSEMFWNLENPNYKFNTGDPSLDCDDEEEPTRPLCMGSDMPSPLSFGGCFGTEKSRNGMKGTDVAPQDKRSLFFEEEHLFTHLCHI